MIDDLSQADEEDPLFVNGQPEIAAWQYPDAAHPAEAATATSTVTLPGESGQVKQVFSVENGCFLATSGCS